MNYGLKILHRIVAGDLNPSNRQTDNFEHHIQFLQKYVATNKRCIRIDFSGYSSQQLYISGFGDYTLQNTDHWLGEDLQPPSENQEIEEQLINRAISALNISRNNIEKFHITTFVKCIRLELVVRQDHKDLQRNEAKFYFYQFILSRAVERIKQILHEDVFKLCSQKEISTYIRHYQSTLENISVSLASCLPEIEKSNLYQLSMAYTLDDIYKIIYRYVDDLRVYIDRHFTKYINLDATVPYQSRICHTIDIGKKARSIYQKILHSSIDTRLFNILECTLKKIAHLTKQASCTYKELIYYRTLLNELQAIFQEGVVVSTQIIVDLLFRLNFNAVPFFNYSILRIEEELAKKQRTEDKLLLLYHYHKLYKQAVVQAYTAYNTNLPGIKDQVVVWLKEEIAYYEKIQEIDKQAEKQSSVVQEPSVKLKTSLSVAQIAYLMRVMYEAEVISNEHQWEIARFVSESTCTEKSSKISYESLYSKYYNVENSTYKTIKEVIIRMLNYVNKDK
jgi:hypothetical protein